jgi:chemotaxis protein MotB
MIKHLNPAPVVKRLHQVSVMKRLSKRNEEGHTDRWMVSYADFITLLFAFFVVMYSISTVNEGQYRAMSDSIAYAMAMPSIPTSPLIINEPPSIPTVKPRGSNLNKVLADKHTAQLGAEQRKIEEHMKQLAADLSQVLDSIIKQNNVRITLTKRGVVVDISDSTLFDTGEATLKAVSLNVLRAVARVLSKEDMPVEIEGHTDDIPISTAKFPSNWELSSVRASSVARLLMDNGVPEKRLSVIGLASNQPLLPNTSAENRSKNRRVTITIASPNLDRN